MPLADAALFLQNRTIHSVHVDVSKLAAILALAPGHGPQLPVSFGARALATASEQQGGKRSKGGEAGAKAQESQVSYDASRGWEQDQEL